MKNRIIFLVLGLILSTQVCSQENPDSLIRLNKVQKVFIYEGNNLVGKIFYDENYNQIYEYFHNFMGSPITTTDTKEFNAENMLISSKSTHSSFEGDTTYWVYSYNSFGKVETISDGYLKTPIFTFEYNSNQQIIKQLRFNSDGEVKHIETHKYDSSGLEIELNINSDFLKNRVIKYYYNSKGLMAKSERSTDGKDGGTTIFEYDERGNKIKSHGTRNNDGQRYYYDEHNRLIKRTIFEIKKNEEITKGTVKLSYYNNGLLKEISGDIFSFDGKTKTYRFEYK